MVVQVYFALEMRVQIEPGLLSLPYTLVVPASLILCRLLGMPRMMVLGPIPGPADFSVYPVGIVASGIAHSSAMVEQVHLDVLVTQATEAILSLFCGQSRVVLHSQPLATRICCECHRSSFGAESDPDLAVQ